MEARSRHFTLLMAVLEVRIYRRWVMAGRKRGEGERGGWAVEVLVVWIEESALMS